MSGRVCLFCGQRPLTKEHVYPRWLGQLREPRVPDAIPTPLLFRGKWVRDMHGLDIQIRAVCGPCNHGWMHDLEGAFRAAFASAISGKAMEHGQAIDLDRGAQQVIATWGIKTWLLLELALKEMRQHSVETTILPWLYTEHAPPPEVQVFIGAVANTDYFSQFATLSVQGDDHALVAFMACLTIRHVAFVFYMPATPVGEITGPALQIADRFAAALTQIWPYQVTEVCWPPKRVFTDRLILSLIPEVGLVEWREIPWFRPI